MNLQAGVVPYDYFVAAGLGPQTRCINYDPGAPLHERYLLDTDFLGPEDRSVLEDMTLTINSFFGWDFNSCEALRKDGIWYPIDFANASPRFCGHLAALPLSWLIKANVRWSLFCAATKRRICPTRLGALLRGRWQVTRHPASGRAPTPGSRTSASRPIGSRSSAADISAISTRSPASCSDRRSPGMPCTRRSSGPVPAARDRGVHRASLEPHPDVAWDQEGARS